MTKGGNVAVISGIALHCTWYGSNVQRPRGHPSRPAMARLGVSCKIFVQLQGPSSSTGSRGEWQVSIRGDPRTLVWGKNNKASKNYIPNLWHPFSGAYQRSRLSAGSSMGSVRLLRVPGLMFRNNQCCTTTTFGTLLRPFERIKWLYRDNLPPSIPA